LLTDRKLPPVVFANGEQESQVFASSEVTVRYSNVTGTYFHDT
jgi:hypothetical protein